jgi:thiol-disulfide isomerase/thioredoxin
MAPIKKISLLFLLFTVLAEPFVRADEYYYDLNDKKFTYDQLIAKSKTVLFVWATWCPTCREEIKDFTSERNVRQDVNIVFLESGEKRSDVLDTIKHLAIPKTMTSLFYRDPFQEIMNRFFISTVPTVIFFQDSQIVKTAHSLTARLVDQVYPPEKDKVSDAHNK